MKKLLSAVALMMVASTSYATMSYECWTYVGGHPDKMINRSANSKAEAEQIATAWFQSNGYKFDYVTCK